MSLNDSFALAGKTYRSRLLVGTGKYKDLDETRVAIEASGAEIVGEVADLLIRCQGIRRVLCGALVGDDVILSVRTKKDTAHAAKLVQATLAGIGGGGGHAHRAGGKIPNVAASCRDELENDLRTRWLTVCNVDRQRGTRLVARREIVENL